jgi:hypothetical protein
MLFVTIKIRTLSHTYPQISGATDLVDWVDDPVDAGIAADGLVLRVDEDDFVVLVG